MRLLKWIAGFLTLAAMVAGGAVLYLTWKPPRMAAASNRQVERTPERIERGRYLVNHLIDCFGCHAERDFSRFGGPVIPGTEGKGLERMALEGLPGTVAVPNITSDPDSGLGRWSDGEILRAIREGVDRDGRALFPLMPYPSYRSLSDADAEATVAYLRTLPPVKTSWPRSKIDFPVNLLIKDVPQPVGSVPEVNRSDRLAHGRYLVTVAGCAECHTPEEKGRLVQAKLFAGGRLFATPAGSVYSANITSDPDTGIGKWTEEYFIHKVRSYRPYAEAGSPPVGAESFTLMPWLGLSGLTDEDLAAIYGYLRTLPPIPNAVEKHRILEAPLGAGQPAGATAQPR